MATLDHYYGVSSEFTVAFIEDLTKLRICHTSLSPQNVRESFDTWVGYQFKMHQYGNDITGTLVSLVTSDNDSSTWNVTILAGNPVLFQPGYITHLSINPTGAGGGEANTASNVGAGSGVFKVKTGVNLEFKTLTPADAKITVVPSGADEIDIGFGSVAINDLSDVNAAPINGDVLTYNTGTLQWEAVAPSGGLAAPVLGQGEDVVNWSGAVLRYEKPWEVGKPDALSVIRRFVNSPVVANGQFALLTAIGPDVSTATLTDPIIAIRVSKANWFGIATEAVLFLINGWAQDQDRVMLASTCSTTTASRYLGYNFTGGGAADEGVTFRWPISANTGSGVLVNGDIINLATDQQSRDVIVMVNNNISRSPNVPDQLMWYAGATNTQEGLHQLVGNWAATGSTANLNALVTPTVLNTYTAILASNFVFNGVNGWTLNALGEVNRLVLEPNFNVLPYKAYDICATISLLTPAGLTRVISLSIVTGGATIEVKSTQTTTIAGGQAANISLKLQRTLPVGTTGRVEIGINNQTDNANLSIRHAHLTIIGIV